MYGYTFTSSYSTFIEKSFLVYGFLVQILKNRSKYTVLSEITLFLMEMTLWHEYILSNSVMDTCSKRCTEAMVQKLVGCWSPRNTDSWYLEDCCGVLVIRCWRAEDHPHGRASEPIPKPSLAQGGLVTLRKRGFPLFLLLNHIWLLPLWTVLWWVHFFPSSSTSCSRDGEQPCVVRTPSGVGTSWKEKWCAQN